jgi:ATP-dependent DNA helicase RecG
MNGENPTPALSDLLADGMNIGVHWFPEDVPPSRLAEIFIGMANTHGGTVLLGVSPRSGQIQGVSDPEVIKDRVFQAASLSDPPLVLPIPRIHKLEGINLVEVHIPQGLPHVYNLNGRYFGREGRHTVPLTARRLRHLLQGRGVFPFESQVPPEASMDDLNQTKIDSYLEHLQPIPSLSRREVLQRRGCLRQIDGIWRPTYAGILLFGVYPQQWVPSGSILATRFTGTSLADEFLKYEMDGTLPEQLRQAEGFIRDHLRQVVRLVGFAREETPEYPLAAIRELLVNAVAHRDYNLQGDTIHIYIFADRLEIHSPGGLPGPVNLENILTARFSRNPIIVQVLSDLGYVERLGYGLNRVVNLLRRQSHRPPHFEEVAGTFRVTLFAEPSDGSPVPDLSVYRDLELNPRQTQALHYLVSHHRITNRAYQEICPDVHPETLRRDLADLVSKGALLKIGQKRATYYILKTPSALQGDDTLS